MGLFTSKLEDNLNEINADPALQNQLHQAVSAWMNTYGEQPDEGELLAITNQVVRMNSPLTVYSTYAIILFVMGLFAYATIRDLAPKVISFFISLT